MHFVDVFLLKDQACIEEFHVVGVENRPGQFHARLELNEQDLPFAAGHTSKRYGLD